MRNHGSKLGSKPNATIKLSSTMIQTSHNTLQVPPRPRRLNKRKTDQQTAGLKRRQEEDGEALENECVIEGVLSLTPGFSSDVSEMKSVKKPWRTSTEDLFVSQKHQVKHQTLNCYMETWKTHKHGLFVLRHIMSNRMMWEQFMEAIYEFMLQHKFNLKVASFVNSSSLIKLCECVCQRYILLLLHVWVICQLKHITAYSFFLLHKLKLLIYRLV